MAVVLVLVAGGVVWLWWLSNRQPDWWTPLDVNDESIVDLGYDTENFVMTQIHDVRQTADEWHIRLRDEQMNAWLAVNLPQWFEHETGRAWPAELPPPIVDASTDVVRIGFQLPSRFGDRVITARFSPTISAEGLRTPMVGAAIGNVPVPAARVVTSLVSEHFADRIDEQARATLVAISRGELPIDPVIELADGRIVEIRAITLEDDAVVLTCRTLRPGPGDMDDEPG